MLSGDVHSSFTAELINKSDPSDFKVISVVSSPYYWPYPHNPRRAFSLDGEIKSTLSDNVYQVVNPGSVYATDNFTRITVSLTRMKVQSFGRKGNLLGGQTYSF
jgi:alkaline phosphatase D